MGPPPLARPARAVLLAGLVLTAGCSALAPPDDARAPREPTARPLVSVEPPPATTSCRCSPGGPHFELHHVFDGTVTVTVVDVTAGGHEVVADGVYTEQYDVLEFDPVMRYGSDYRVVVRVDGHVAWNRTVSRAEGYEVLVTENGTVTVLSHGGV